MKISLIFSIITFILILGFVNTYFLFGQTYSQSFFTYYNGHVNHTQIKTVPFENLAKCIRLKACRPIIGSEGSDLIQPNNDSHVVMDLG